MKLTDEELIEIRPLSTSKGLILTNDMMIIRLDLLFNSPYTLLKIAYDKDLVISQIMSMNLGVIINLKIEDKYIIKDFPKWSMSPGDRNTLTDLIIVIQNIFILKHEKKQNEKL